MKRRELLFVALLAALLVAPQLAPYDSQRTAPDMILAAPSMGHLLGTDALGRDVFSRLLVGGQRTLMQGLAAAGLAVSLGGLAGLVMSSGPRLVAVPVRAVSTALLAAPQLVWSLAILSLLGAGPGPLVLAVGLPLAAPMAAVSRAALERVQATPFVAGAHAIGAGRMRIATRHLLPNAVSVMARYSAVLFAYAVLNSAGLAFLGFSEPGEPEWGAMLSEARMTFRASPWPALASGVAITVLVWGALALARRSAQPMR
jgi:peptide/nickel transport system permease protein